MKRLLVLAALLLPATAGVAQGAEHLVTIPGLQFEPSRISVLVGDTVTWENEDAQLHTATSDDGSFDSGFLEPGQRFSYTFTAQGSYAYVCTLHSFMRGRVDAFSIALSASDEAVRPRGQATLSGRAPAEVTEVAIEEEHADGSFGAIGSVPTEPDGSFSFDVFPRLPTSYRAVAGELASPTVLVSVSARVELRFAARTDEGTWLLALSTPSQARAPVVLQRYARELFTWIPYTRVPHARSCLDRNGKTRFLVSPRQPIQVRLVLLRGVGGYGPAISPPVWVRPAASG